MKHIQVTLTDDGTTWSAVIETEEMEITIHEYDDIDLAEAIAQACGYQANITQG